MVGTKSERAAKASICKKKNDTLANLRMESNCNSILYVSRGDRMQFAIHRR